MKSPNFGERSGSSKIDRINSELKKQLAIIIDNDLHDPRVVGMISVLKVETDSELSLAKVYLSIMGANGKEKECVKAINNASGFIKNILKKEINMRAIPNLIFMLDGSIEYGIKISQILNNLNITEETETETEDKE